MHTATIDQVETVRAARAVTVRSYVHADRVSWERFVDLCPDATFFHRIGWQEIVEDVFRHRTHFLLAEDRHAITGVLPLAEVRSWLFGHALVSLPFGVYGGPAAGDETSRRALVDAAVELARKLGVAHMELRNRMTVSPDWPRQDLYVTFRRQISADVEANMLAIPRKQRAMVRKGINNGLRSEVDESVDRFFSLYADNMHRHGTPPLPRAYFAQLRRTFGDQCEVLTVSDASGCPLSSVLSFYFRDEVLPYYAGDAPAAREQAANDFKYWELMRRACERGIRWFDFGRSKRGTGSFAFKRNWGFEATPLSYEYCLLGRNDVPQNNPLNPKYRLLVALWRRIPLRVANTLGPLVARNLG